MKKTAVGIGRAVAALACFAGFEALAEVQEVSFMTAKPAEKSPEIDGAADDACWRGAEWHEDYFEYLKPNPRRMALKTKSAIVYDAQGVYVAVVNSEPSVGTLRRRIVRNNDGDIWRDDSAEIYFDPAANGVQYYKFTVNSLGKLAQTWRMDPANTYYDWTAAGVKSAAKVGKDFWSLELFVPWSAFHGRAAAKPGDLWTFNHSRFRFAEGVMLMSSAPGASGTSANKFGWLYFSGSGKTRSEEICGIISKRQNGEWGVSIGGKTYMGDSSGFREIYPEKIRAELEKELAEATASLAVRLPALGDPKATARFESAKAALKNELARWDGSFASIKALRGIAGDMEDLGYVVSVRDLAQGAAAKPVVLPLAGTYPLDPPAEYDGHNGWFRHNPRKENCRTPHLDWGSKTFGGSPKVLFLGTLKRLLRDQVEIDQRFAMEALYFPGNFGATGVWEDPVSFGSPADKTKQFETLLAKNPQVVVVDRFATGSMKAKYLFELLRRVRDEGMGLVLDGGTKQLVAGVRKGMKELPAGDAAKWTGEKRFAFGKGRIVETNFGIPPGWTHGWKAAWETRMAGRWNGIRWAAGLPEGAAFRFPGKGKEDKLAADADAYGFVCTTPEAAGADELYVRIRDVRNRIVKEETHKLGAGENEIKVAVDALPGGMYRVDAISRKNGETAEVASRIVEKAGSLGAMTLDGEKETVIPEGTTPLIEAQWEREAPGAMRLEWEMETLPYGDIVGKGSVDVAAKEKSAKIACIPEIFPTMAGVLSAKLVCAETGKAVAAAVKTVFFPNHRFEDYTTIGWESLDAQGMGELLAPQVVEGLGYRNHLGESGNASAAVNGRAVPYITRVLLTRSKTGATKWNQMPGVGSKEFKRRGLDREDTGIFNPAAREVIEHDFTNRVAKSVPYGVCVWNLGDECGYEKDIGYGASERWAYEAFLEKRYGTVARYNEAHGTDCKSFKDAPHRPLDEALAAGDWPAWFDQIQFAATIYSETFRELSEMIKRYDPKARVGAEGSAGGDLEETISHLEFWGAYRNVIEDELVRNLGPNLVRGAWWGGYVRDSRDGFPQGQWEFLLTGTANADEFFTTDPGSTESALAGDFSFAPYVVKMLPHMKEMRRGLAQLLIRTPLRTDPYAIWHSRASECCSLLDEKFFRPKDSTGEIIRFAYRNGYDVPFVTERTAAKLAGRKLLFLCGAVALSDNECSLIADFIRSGGVAVADSLPGAYDRYLVRRKTNPLAPLFAEGAGEKRVGKGRTVLLGHTIGAYAVENGAEASDKLLQKIFDGVGIKAHEYVNGLTGDTRILRTRLLGDMKLVGFKTGVHDLGKQVEIGFGCEGYAYAYGEGFAAKGDKVVISSLDKPFRLYAVFPEKQKAPEFDVKAEAAPGEAVEVSTDKLRRGGVYRVEVRRPNGKPVAWREQVVTADGSPVRVHFAYNDAPGGYAIEVTDVATGLSSARTVRIGKGMQK